MQQYRSTVLFPSEHGQQMIPSAMQPSGKFIEVLGPRVGLNKLRSPPQVWQETCLSVSLHNLTERTTSTAH